MRMIDKPLYECPICGKKIPYKYSECCLLDWIWDKK